MVSAPPAATRLAGQFPATYVGFDLLAAAAEDLRLRTWRERRTTLEALWAGCRPPLELSPYTADRATALEWLRDYPEATGVEGTGRERHRQHLQAGRPRLDQDQVETQP